MLRDRSVLSITHLSYAAFVLFIIQNHGSISAHCVNDNRGGGILFVSWQPCILYRMEFVSINLSKVGRDKIKQTNDNTFNILSKIHKYQHKIQN